MEEINLKELFSYVKPKLIWVLVAVLAVVIIGNVFTLLTREPMYQSNTTIVLVGESKDEYKQTDSQLNKNLIGTYSQIIKSRKVLSQVIDNLDLKVSVKKLSDNIVTTSEEDTEIIKITVSDPSAKKAKKITDEVALVFAKEIKDIYKLENVTIIDKAELAKAPYNVNYVKDNIIYILIGLVMSFGVVFVMYYFDTSIKSSEVVEEKLGLTVLGVVPKVVDKE